MSSVSAVPPGAERPIPSGRRLSGSGADALLTLAVLVAVLAVWQWASTVRIISPLLLPSPLAIGQGLVTLLTSPFYYEHMATTAYEATAGFAIGAVVGIAIAILLTHLPTVGRFASPYIVAFQVLPKVALAPLLVIWLGFGVESKIALSIAISFFPILISTMRGIERVPGNAVRLMQSLGASRRQIFMMLTLRVAMPYMFAGLRAGATLALIGAVVGEFVTARVGLGKLLTIFAGNAQQPLVWATTVVIGALGLILYGAVALAGRRLVWWRP